MSTWVDTARDRLAALEAYASQVEDGDRTGDLGALLIGSAIAAALLAVAENTDGVIYVANANAI